MLRPINTDTLPNTNQSRGFHRFRPMLTFTESYDWLEVGVIACWDKTLTNAYFVVSWSVCCSGKSSTRSCGRYTNAVPHSLLPQCLGLVYRTKGSQYTLGLAVVCVCFIHICIKTLINIHTVTSDVNVEPYGKISKSQELWLGKIVTIITHGDYGVMYKFQWFFWQCYNTYYTVYYKAKF